MLDINSGLAEARTLHPASDGWFAILQKSKKGDGKSSKSVKQSMHHMVSLEAVVRAVGTMPDTYVSQSSFICAKRRVATFKSVNCAFVDIDCYSDKPNSPKIVPDENFVDQLRANARAAGLPEPSYITFSGRGVYCKWVFDRPITANQLLRWQALQNVLTPLYTAFGVDASARDAARVLRVMGSKHAEAGSIVRVAVNTNAVHSFESLCRAAEQVDTAKLVWPSNHKVSGRAVEARINKTKKKGDLLGEFDQCTDGDLSVLANYEASREPAMLKFGTRDHLNWSRFCDIRALAEMRGGIHPGSRDVTLFWMATTLAHAGVVTAENIESEIGELVGAFSGAGFDPIGDRSMMSLVERLKEKEAGRVVHFKGGSYDPLYTPTNDHLIDVLGITSEEQKKLTTIIGGEEKLRRADAKVEGRADRRQRRIEWHGLAREMEAAALAAGETRYKARIAREVEVDVRQVSRLLDGKLDRDLRRVETRGRKKSSAKPMVRVVERFGSLTRSVWFNVGLEQPAVCNMAGALATTTERERAEPAEPVSIRSFPPEILCSLALAFPNRVVFSTTREREQKKEAFARKAESKVFQAGGPQAQASPKVDAHIDEQTPADSVAGVKPAGETSTNAVWTGWGPLAAIAQARSGISGKRQANQKVIPSEGWVKITRPDGRTKSIPLIPIAAIMKAAKAQAPKSPKKLSGPTPIYMDAKTGEIDFTKLRAEVLRIQEERARATEAARIRDVAIDEAARARVALAASNRLKEIIDRSKRRATVEDKDNAAQKSLDQN